jgi:pyruvate,orthophosphate dikinase
MILSKTEAERRVALDELFPFVKRDIKATSRPCRACPDDRLLDPPQHEFVPKSPEKQAELAQAWYQRQDVAKRGERCTSPIR